MKLRYRLLILFGVFIIAMFIFSGDIKETFFSSSAETAEMSGATLPIVTLSVDDNEVNALHGYISNLDEMVIRETITPLTSERTFTVLIDEHESVVKKLKYEVFSEDGRELESDSFTVLDVENGPKKVKISLKETMKSGKEYVAKITLITNQSKRIYYYTRLKMYDDGHLFEKLEFAKDFHNALLTGTAEEQEALKKYLESSKRWDNSTFAKINIKSSFEMVTWGDLEPVVVWEEVPTVTEFYDSMASVRLTSLVSVNTDSGTELYRVNEDFRFNYTTSRTYLYNYDRTMEALFDVKNTSLSKDEFKLGITNDTDAQTGWSDSQKYLAFVYGRELMLYDVDKNVLTKVFSFREGNSDYTRDLYDAHGVKLIKVHDNGNADFMVYGYMNRGEYEGRVGVVLYRYVKADERIEEQLYIPVNSSYQILASDMTDFAYLSGQDIFYYSIYDAIYSYNMMTGVSELLAMHVPESNLIFCEEDRYLAWQDDPDDTAAKHIHILDLESGNIHSVEAGADEAVKLYGSINNNIIYGYARQSDVCIYADGSKFLPAYRLCIEDGFGNVMKDYQDPDIYISDIEAGENILMINRVTKKLGTDNVYAEAESDSIMNRLVVTEKPVSVSKRVTDRTLTEYYISLPNAVDIEKTPSLVKSKCTVINRSTTTRVTEPEDRTLLYYAYSFGEVVYSSENAAETISKADELTGTVINKDGRLIWERGVKATRSEISGLTCIPTDSEHDSVQAAMKMLLEYKNLDTDTTGFDKSRDNIYGWLMDNMKSTPVNLTGATLDEVLYYVYKSRPVIAIKPDNSACVIMSYDATSVTVYEPARGKAVKYSTKDATTMFESAGNIFISYVD